MKRSLRVFEKNKPLLSAVVLMVLLTTAFAASVLAQSDDEWLPTNPLQGRTLFEEKLCITCHAIGGAGGSIGPDLTQIDFKGTFLDLSALLWNHVPDMVVEYKNLNLPWPGFSNEELYSLISYLYYLRYLGEPGDVQRGKKLVRSKGCTYCHRVGGEGGNGIGPKLDKLKKYASPMYMIQAIWNHGPKMQKKMDEMGIERPTFSGRDIVDISAYIRAVSKWETQENVYISPGNPKAGSEVFRKKGCFSCHPVHGKGGGIGPELDKKDLTLSVTEIAGRMWNHSDKMWQTMRHEKMSWPTFDGKEMADLLAYLYFLNFKDEPGNPGKGREVFAAKCMVCHSIRGEGGSLASDLAEAPYLGSNLSVLRAMLDQADKMSETALKTGTSWPNLTGKELRNLFAYLATLKKD